MRLVIGVPARNEADNIAQLADRLEAGGLMLPAGWKAELVLAYQSSRDDTLQRWCDRRSRLPQRLLRCPPEQAGKGRNVKLLRDYAVERDADYLLLVDADLQEYEPANVPLVASVGRERGHDLVLPLWSRAYHQGNTTNYFASPLLRAAYGSRIRQPLAGHALLSGAFCRQLASEELPNDYGVDIAVTIAALVGGWSVGQVLFPPLQHSSNHGTSDTIMLQVARTALQRLAAASEVDRRDVTWPPCYWRQMSWPDGGGHEARDFWPVVERHARSAEELAGWRRWVRAAPSAVRDMWCARLATAISEVASGAQDPAAAAEQLVCPFFVHAWHRAAHPWPSVAQAERYVAELGVLVADRVGAPVADAS